MYREGEWVTVRRSDGLLQLGTVIRDCTHTVMVQFHGNRWTYANRDVVRPAGSSLMDEDRAALAELALSIGDKGWFMEVTG